MSTLWARVGEKETILIHRSASLRNALLGLIVLAGAAFGQGLISIQGSVYDPNGAVIPGAKLVLTQPSTGQARTITADQQGNYLIPAVPPSTYDLDAQAPGFRPSHLAGITVLADQNITLNIHMQLGDASQAITVEAGAALVDTVTGTQKQVISQTQMVELPLNGRNAAQLSFLVAGAAPSIPGGALQGISKVFPSQIVVSTNGVQQDQVSYLLDGGTYNDELYSVNQPFPFPDALQEFSVQTSNYGAQYGNNAGGVVNIITKSGTNQLHGDLFEFDRNAVFNARNYFSAKRDQLRRNQFGFTAGGPLWLPHVYNGKNKTFWFFGYQGTRIRNNSAAQSAFVPTQAELNGDFSAYLTAQNPNNPLQKAVQVIDPKSGQPFPGNIIPVSRFDPAALGLEKYLPKPTGQGLAFYQVPTVQNENETVERFDHSFSAADQLSFRGAWNRYTSAAVFDPTSILSLSGGSTLSSHNYLLHETHIFQPNLLNEARLTYWRMVSSRYPAPNAPNATALGVQNLYQTSPPTLDSISVTGFFSVAQNPLAMFVRQGEAFADDVNWIRGKHNMQFGMTIEKSRFDLVNNNGADGAFSFTADTTNLALASYLLGYLRTFTQQAGQPINIRDTFAGVYAQDSYRASRRLTLTMGLRWEPGNPWNEVKGRFNYFSPANYYAGVKSTIFTNAPVGLLFRGDKGVPPGIGITPDYHDFMPRLGFAYDLFGDGRTSIRGGGGMFYNTRTAGDLAFTQVGNVVPFVPQFSITQPQGPFSNPLLGYANPFPAPGTPPANAAFQSPVVVTTIDTSHRQQITPVTYNWNISIEHQFGSGWLSRIGYVGTHSSHIRELAQLNPAVYMPGSTLTSDQRRVFPGYGSIVQTTDDVNSHYSGLQLSLEKRISQTGFFHGLTVLANYTWSKAIDDLPVGSGVEGTPVSTIPFWFLGRHQLDYGVSDFDHTHLMVFSYNWQLPAFSSTPRYTRALLGNWEMSGILTMQSGDPFTVLAGKDQSQTALNEDRAVYLGPAATSGTGACGNTSPCINWLNPASFTLPAIGTFGNVGRNSIRGPGLINWDMALFKNIPIRESVRLQIRGEVFNILNHTNPLDPGVAPGGTPVASVSVTSAGFGSIRAAADPRIMQLAMKLTF